MTFRVYISSTFEDLIEHRSEVRKQLQMMQVHDVSMETYIAAEQAPLDHCIADVKSSGVIALFPRF
jgi:hypothetical protein